MCDPSETDEIEEDKSVKQERYEVTGMTCSACSSRVEKCVSKIDGVENVSVNLLTNSMQVSYDENKVNEDIIVSEVEKAGYGAALANAGNEKRTGKGKRINKAEQEIHEMKIRLAANGEEGCGLTQENIRRMPLAPSEIARRYPDLSSALLTVLQQVSDSIDRKNKMQ